MESFLSVDPAVIDEALKEYGLSLTPQAKFADFLCFLGEIYCPCRKIERFRDRFVILHFENRKDYDWFMSLPFEKIGLVSTLDVEVNLESQDWMELP